MILLTIGQPPEKSQLHSVRSRMLVQPVNPTPNRIALVHREEFSARLFTHGYSRGEVFT